MSVESFKSFDDSDLSMMPYILVSGSGTQIIALGVMLGVLIVVFHGLTLFRSIRKKQKLSKIASK